MPLDYKQKRFFYKEYFFKKARELYEQPATKASIGLIASLLVISFFGIFALRPTLVTIADLIGEIREQKEIDQALGRKINDLTRAQTAYFTIEPDISIIEEALPKNPRFIRFTQKLKFLAHRNGLIITSFNFGEFNLFGLESELESDKLNGNNRGLVDFNIAIAGQYQDLKNFLSDLERLDRIVVIKSVDFSEESKIQSALEARILGTIFYLPD